MHEKRRKEKQLKEAMQMVMAMPCSDVVKDGLRQMNFPEELIEKATMMIGITAALVNKAMAGDVTAYNAIRDILGEKPVDETKLTGGLDTNITIGFVDSGVEPVGDEEDVEI